MKRSRICLGILITSFFSFFFLVPVNPVLGFEFSYPEYWFYVTKPETIDYPDIFFQVTNNEDFSITVTCAFEQVEGLNVSINLDWKVAVLEPLESRKNHYAIQVNELFNGSYPLRIYLKAEAGGNLLSGGVVVNRIFYFSEAEGYLFDLRIVDQSDQLRESFVKIHYKHNDSMSWTPFKQFNGSSYKAYLPSGWYEIIAHDLETTIIGKEVIFLDNDTQIDVTLKLVGFDYFEVITDNYLYIGVNSTIDNHVDTLEEVYIFAELLLEGNVLSQSTVEYRENLETTTGIKMVMWFPFTNWTEEVRYEVRGYIYSSGLLVAQEQRFFDSFFVYEEKTNKNAIPQEVQTIIIFVVGLGLGLSIVFIHDKVINRKYDEIEDEMAKTN